MLDENLQQELDERLLADMPERALIILSLRQNNKEHKAMGSELAKIITLQKSVTTQKTELKWMWRVIGVGLLGIIYQIVRTFFGGK